LKKEFKKPYGKVYTSIEQIRDLVKNKKLVAVGDIISSSLINAGIIPNIIVFDKKQNRMDVSDDVSHNIDSFEAKEFFVKNPASTISRDLWEAVEKSLELKQRAKIFVDGEEDLAVTPFVMKAEDNTLIAYGLKGKGFVLLKVDRYLKQECKALLDKMEGW